MPKRRPFKKSLTPIGRRGSISTNVGKGAREQRTMPGQQESLTGGDPFSRMGGAYPKDAPPAPAPGGSIGPQPTALMPGLGMGVPDEDV